MDKFQLDKNIPESQIINKISSLLVIVELQNELEFARETSFFVRESYQVE